MSKIISQLEFWLILFGLAAVPNWSWPAWGSAEESQMMVIGLVVAGLVILLLIDVILKHCDRISLGFFKSPLNWILNVPLFLVIAGAAKDGVLFAPYQLFGFGVPWRAAGLPVFLLLAWHFLLRSFWSESPVVRRLADEGWRSDRIHYSSPTTPTPPQAGGDKHALLKFAFAWCVVFSLVALIRRRPSFTDIGLWFALGSILALALAALRVPLSAHSLSPPLTKGGIRGGLRLGRLIYVPFAVLLVALGFFIRFEIRVARAAAAANRNDFAAARKFNPYQPLYSISWVEQEIANLEKMDLTADVAAAKEKVGEIVKELEGVSSMLPASLSFLRKQSLPRTRYGESSFNDNGLDSGSPPMAEAGMTLRSAQAWERLGKFAEGASEKAVAIYDSLIAAQGAEPDSSLIIKKALLLEKSGKTNEAIEWLRQLLSPDRILRSGDKPIGSISGSLTRSPEATGVRDDSAARYHLGRLLYNSGKEKEAAEIWLNLLKDDPDYADVNYSLGAYFARQGKAVEALNYFQKVRQLAPDNVEVKKKIDELNRKR